MGRNLINKLKQIIKNPKKILNFLDYKGLFNFLSDKIYLKLMFRVNTGKKLNLDNPKTFNEKLQWLKLNDRKDIYTTMVDKYEVKKYIADLIGEEYIIPTLGVWDRFEDIDFEKLPNQFVLKCTHDSGGLVICRDKTSLNIKSVKRKINKCLKRNYYKHGREWPYKNVKPRIIAEKYLEGGEDFISKNYNGNDKNVLTDYKFFCFNGEPKIMYLSKDKAKEPKTDFFDMNFTHLDLRMRDPNSSYIPNKPSCFDIMKNISKVLSKNIAHLRVDFYNVDGHIYVGELTFFHCCGFAYIRPERWNYILGEWIKLEK